MKDIIKICRHCGNTFTTTCRTQRYCSEECKYNAHFYGETCIICGKPTQDHRRTCSKECEKLNSIQNCVFKTDKVKEKIKATNLERYGVENPMQNTEISRKSFSNKLEKDPDYINNWVQKAQNTMFERYGVYHALQDSQFLTKMEDTINKTGISYRFHTPEWETNMLQKYGTTVPYQNTEIKEKGINTVLSRYGVTSPAKLDWVKEKSKSTCLEKYGVEYSFQSEVVRKKTKQTLMEKYGVENILQLHRKISKLNLKIAEAFDIVDFEFPIGTRSFDLKTNNILLEINPTITHSSTSTIYKDGKPLEPDYHLMKTTLALQNGYRCIHIWDWDDTDKIKNLIISTKTNIYARKCEVAFIDKVTSDNFLDLYHLQSKCQGDLFRIGLIYNDELIGIMTFGLPRYTNKYEYELLRLCYKPGFKVTGGSAKMLTFFKQMCKPNSIISYCDNSKFNGNTYLNLGFTKVSNGNPTKHWYNIKLKIHITDNLLRQRGFDQLLGDKFGVFGKDTNNEELMLQHGFDAIYDCGQSVYVWDSAMM